MDLENCGIFDMKFFDEYVYVNINVIYVNLKMLRKNLSLRFYWWGNMYCEWK